MNSLNVSLLIFLFVMLWIFLFYCKCYDPLISGSSGSAEDGTENYLGGYGVISGLAMNNRSSVYYPGNDRGWSGGYIIPHRVIV